MRVSEKTDFVFELAKKYLIPYEPNKDESISDESFTGFLDEYENISIERDTAVKKYLQTNPKLFRSILPYTADVFGVAAKIIWYYDELLIRDPITLIGHLKSAENIESNKQRLVQVLRVLFTFREALESGFILLAGSKILPNLVESGFENIVCPKIDQLLTRREVKEVLESSTYYGMDIRKDAQGRDWTFFQVDTGNGFLLSIQAENLPPGSNASPAYRVGEFLPQVERAKLFEHMDPEFCKQIEGLYPKEIKVVVHNITLSSLLNTPILFHKDRDAIIADHAGYSESIANRGSKGVVGLNLCLPYIYEIDPRRLMDLRKKIPAAFLEMRGQMTSMIEEVNSKVDPLDVNLVLSERARCKIAPNLEKLKREMEDSTRINRLTAYGSTGIALSAMLLGVSVGPGLLPLIGTLSAGAIMTSLKSFSDQQRVEKKELPNNPFYFLWKARQ